MSTRRCVGSIYGGSASRTAPEAWAHLIYPVPLRSATKECWVPDAIAATGKKGFEVAELQYHLGYVRIEQGKMRAAREALQEAAAIANSGGEEAAKIRPLIDDALQRTKQESEPDKPVDALSRFGGVRRGAPKGAFLDLDFTAQPDEGQKEDKPSTSSTEKKETVAAPPKPPGKFADFPIKEVRFIFSEKLFSRIEFSLKNNSDRNRFQAAITKKFGKFVEPSEIVPYWTNEGHRIVLTFSLPKEGGVQVQIRDKVTWEAEVTGALVEKTIKPIKDLFEGIFGK